MKHLLIIVTIVAGFFASGCKTPLEYKGSYYERMPEERKIPYELSSPGKHRASLLLVVPDDPDTTRTAVRDIILSFHDEGYHVLIAEKPGADIYKKRVLDSREERIEDIVKLVNALDSLWSADLVILGYGQGGYLLPALGQRLEPSMLIAVNTGSLSPLAELEYIAAADSLSESEQQVLNRYGMDQASLEERVSTIKNEPYGALQLAPLANHSWLSYYNNPLLNQLPKVDCPVLWINYQDAPLLSAKGEALVKTLISRLPNYQYYVVDEKTGSDLSVIIKEFRQR